MSILLKNTLYVMKNFIKNILSPSPLRNKQYLMEKNMKKFKVEK
jgi:hypothetical protein